jgi:hypothetical protein
MEVRRSKSERTPKTEVRGNPEIREPRRNRELECGFWERWRPAGDRINTAAGGTPALPGGRRPLRKLFGPQLVPSRIALESVIPPGMFHESLCAQVAAASCDHSRSGVRASDSGFFSPRCRAVAAGRISEIGLRVYPGKKAATSVCRWCFR